MMLLVAMNMGCVSSSLYTMLKQHGESDSSTQQVNKKALQQIQALRIQHHIATESFVFSFANQQSELSPQEKIRLKAILSKASLKIILHVAPASAKTSFEQVILATQRADKIYQLVNQATQKIEVHFVPDQRLDTLRIELES